LDNPPPDPDRTGLGNLIAEFLLLLFETEFGGILDSAPFLRFIIAGKLQRDTILPLSGKPALDVPGGSLIYAACGLRVWDGSIGLIGRVGEDYPQEWIEQFAARGFDCKGVRVLPKAVDLRYFAAYPDLETRALTNPVSHFSRLGLAFPKTLLGYIEPGNQIDSRTQPTDITIRTSDYPDYYLDATAAHIAPIDFLSHTLLPNALRQGQVATISLDAAAGYMTPVFWDDIPVVLRGINIFHSSEEKLRALFYGRSTDLWEMAETLAGYGCEFIVVKRGQRGQYLYDHTRRNHWVIPAYPARVADPTGAGDAFCGGFLAGLRSTYDPLEAALRGNISASLTIEGPGPFYALDSLPTLAEKRLEMLRDMVHKA
jgi:sugar/nucleoside kinase (ribokinase family)